MGATKSKVDCSPEEETESPSQTSESTSLRVSSRQRHGRHRKTCSDRRWRRSEKDGVSSTPSPDETLLKPFTYRTRKDKLLDSLQAGGDQRNESNSENDDSAGFRPRSNTRLNNEKLSVAKIVENLQANLIAKNGSNSSIRKADDKQRRKRSKTPDVSKTTSGQTASNSLLNIPDRKNKASSRKLKSRKQVKPTGVEEQIIETLIQPRKRRGSLARVEPNDSSDSMDIHSKHATVTFDDQNKGKGLPCKQKSPPPPPIDFTDVSASETESGVRTNPCSSNYPVGQRLDSNKDLEGKTTETSVPRRLPSHLKELKLRFSNDVPRSPDEDNLNDVNKMTLTEKLTTKQSTKPTSGCTEESIKFNFTNDIPLVDSLHILASDKNRRVKSAKTGGKQTSKNPDQRSKNELGGDVERQGPTNTSKASERSRNWKRDVDYDIKESKVHKSILKNNVTQPADDDVINCFTVKTEYDQTKSKTDKDETKDSKTREKEMRRESRRSHRSANKNTRTQTSSTGLIDSSVQTWPDLGLQLLDCKKDAEIQYESTIENKARKILRRFSAERAVKKSPPGEQAERKHERKKYRNGSTQWEEIDLLVNSSCEKVISTGRENDRNRQDRSKKERRPSGRASLKSKSEVRLQNDQGFCKGVKDGKVDASNDENRTEICCMHLQVVPSETKQKKLITNETEMKDMNLLEKKERRRRMPRSCRESEQSLCKRCSQTQFLPSSDGISTAINYATSSCRSRDLSLLSPFCSKTTVGTRASSKLNSAGRIAGAKNKDLYRQMEELGLGFLRDGEWVPTDVISRTLWNNLEKCTENCQATWRRRSRSFTHTKTLKNAG